VLERQTRFNEPLSPEERLAAITIDTRGADHTPAWRGVMRKLSRSRRA
jgi:hypothetical protein